ncbi:MAG: hypothetical protein KDB68_00550 [Planctomycetes bacterium]|nr:hypothetical protein [Planctomycetota bacterium]
MGWAAEAVLKGVYVPDIDKAKTAEPLKEFGCGAADIGGSRYLEAMCRSPGTLRHPD